MIKREKIVHIKHESSKIYVINPYYRKALGFQVLGSEGGNGREHIDGKPHPTMEGWWSCFHSMTKTWWIIYSMIDE